MKLNWKQIWEGHKNNLFPKEELKEFISTTSKERLEICKSCPRNSSPNEVNMLSRCLECGCPLTPKSKCLSCECPLQKWLALTTQEQNQELHNKINEI